MTRVVNTPYDGLEAFDPQSQQLNVIIDTPKGSRNKFSFDEKVGLFKLSGVLPAGASFPFDFGFVPSTVGGDGDPLDVLLLMDEPVFTGCLVPSRLIGVIEAKQTERNGETMRNDRLVAVAVESPTHQNLKTLTRVNANLLKEIEHFFISYNNVKGNVFKPLGRFGPQRAMRLVKEGVEAFRRE
jgi:inorganic pyrophosphatase